MTLRLTPEEYAAFINRQRPGKSPAPRRAEEAGFQRSVTELAKLYSWWVYHAYDKQAVRARLVRPGAGQTRPSADYRRAEISAR